MVEHVLPKHAATVRFRSPAPNLPKAGLILRARRIGALEGPILPLLFLTLSLAGCATVPPSQPISGVYRGEVRAGDFISQTSFIWPVTGTVISSFGSKIDYIKNKGIDIQAPRGSDVRAARAGRVVFRDDKLKGFGKTLILDHGDSMQTVYAYNSQILVSVGDAVKQNEVIAKVGDTGRAKAASLHFEVRKNGRPDNPINYLPD